MTGNGTCETAKGDFYNEFFSKRIVSYPDLHTVFSPLNVHVSITSTSPIVVHVGSEVEDTTAAVLMVDKYGGNDTPGNMAVNTRLPAHAL